MIAVKGGRPRAEALVTPTSSFRAAAEALKWTERVLTRIGLTLNPVKTKWAHAKTQQFEFLG